MQDLLLPAALALAAVVVVVALWIRRRRRLLSAETRPGRPERPDEGSSLGRGERLRAALAKTRDALRERIAVEGQLGDEYFAGIEEALLIADVGVQTTKALLARLRKEVAPGSTRDDVARILGRLLRDILVRPVRPTAPSPTEGPEVILVAGVNGVGKTTTIGKLAAHYRNEGRGVVLVAADTFRAAAVEQLELWAHRVGADVIAQQAGADPAAVVVDGLRAARMRGADVVIVDTAGRLHTKKNLMAELSKVRRMTTRECPGAPHETLLVLDATTGQNGLQQARMFQEALKVTGVVITKMDGTARGGVVVSVVAELGIPIRFVGFGEGPQDLAPFDAQRFVSALLDPETHVNPKQEKPVDCKGSAVSKGV
jgi:fused signal recognition particle receptor